MSMNLCFNVKNGEAIIDFPYQTATKLTYAVMDTKTNEEKLYIRLLRRS